MIWSIILDYQIKGISVEELSAKEGLLLWCKKKTAGYRDVKVENFTNSWVDGLAFCALIHKHRPDLLDFDKLSKKNARENLELAFDVAEKQLGIPRLLDVEDLLDVARPDERSVVTYVSEYFHRFSAQDQFDAMGKRIAKLVALQKTNDQLKTDYLNKAKALVDWINQTNDTMRDRDYGQTLDSINDKWEEFKNYKKQTKPAKTEEKLDTEASLNALQAKLRLNNRPPYQPPTELSLETIDKLWKQLSNEETERADWIRREIERQTRIENLASRFWRRAKALLTWGSDNQALLSSTDYGDSLAAVQAKLKNHEGFEKTLDSSQKRLEATKRLGQELINEGYGKADAIRAKMDDLDGMWSGIIESSQSRRSGLEDALRRQQELDTLRLDFASSSRALISWIEDAEDVLSEPVKVTSIDAIQALQKSFSSFHSDLQAHEGDYSATVDLSNRLVSEGVADNMYATFSIDQVNDRWNGLQNEVAERQRDLEAEHQRQQENEQLCKQFAAAANSFNAGCTKLRDEMSHPAGKDIDAQLQDLKHKADKIGQLNESLDSLIGLNNQIEERSITINKHTDLTVETLSLTFNNLNEFAAKQEALLQKARLAQQGSGVSSEQLQEFRETFKAFDKDGSGMLEKHEFKACMSALGYALSDDQVDRIYNERAKKHPGKMIFEEFVDYMIQRTEDSDTPSSVKMAFKALASDKDHITEDELRRALDPETVSYLLSNMPKTGGKLDYNAFTDKTYRG